jgi:hypothetical protein
MTAREQPEAAPAKRRGRPSGATGRAMNDTYPLRLTTAQRAKLERLGGAPWLRALIDAARESA